MESKPFTLARPAIAFCDAFAPAPALSDAMVLSALGINCVRLYTSAAPSIDGSVEGRRA